ncbi:MAG: hypothetical protein DRG83_16375 [Deltaproteobacteria bacterium]|nr:MAG: hypothetical protein DRG83_16375 [Deltaproteobacteria bacterium]
MIDDQIRRAQEYLSVGNFNERKVIVDIVSLLEQHPLDSVILFLEQFLEETKKTLGNLLAVDRSSPKVNETVALCFRLRMAIYTLREIKEVKAA